ncbi:hypothetical protein [Halocalculus aciditolerans]|uniref:Uncharacterized protein n=1 Tax=Halocalculus aciditolerans TaxID=1383812 RepID=A0A830F9J2_9EURY|nr:hypothetical protein [Halocalculus aciditolerans]GGL52557.1 hypothetical protein GCM10009039_08500 [Halocalculus aciditolerans]
MTDSAPVEPCPDCDRLVNTFVNTTHCPFCNERLPTPDATPPPTAPDEPEPEPDHTER